MRTTTVSRKKLSAYRTPLEQLQALPQPIGINGGSYTYWVNVTRTPLRFTASDGSQIDTAHTLEHIADWMASGDAVAWLEFLKCGEDLEVLRDEGIVRTHGPRDQQGHEAAMR
jgi:hypothetical protein